MMDIGGTAARGGMATRTLVAQLGRAAGLIALAMSLSMLPRLYRFVQTDALVSAGLTALTAVAALLMAVAMYRGHLTTVVVQKRFAYVGAGLLMLAMVALDRDTVDAVKSVMNVVLVLGVLWAGLADSARRVAVNW